MTAGSDPEHHLSQALRGLRCEFDKGGRSASGFSSRRTIEAMLRRRGIKAIKYRDPGVIVLPKSCAPSTKGLLYELMGKYSFRIFLRDLIQFHRQLDMRQLTRYCSEETAHRYLRLLLQHQILRQYGPQQYSFSSDKIKNFGDTLEWFVAEIMQREFDCPSTWGNRLKNSTTGGDYDVISCVENRLLYIEVKSSPPKHIDIPEVRAFMDRVESLRPDAAIFLEDTHLRMKDKLAVIFEEEMQRRYGRRTAKDKPVRRLHEEIFTIENRIFISNSKPDLPRNLTICLKNLLTKSI